MNILITGGAGFLGSHLAKILAKKHLIYIYDIKVLQNYKNVSYIKGNILNTKKIHNILIKKKIDLLFHFAAELGVKQTEKNPNKVININLKGTTCILESVKNTKVKKIFFSSSSEVYGDNKNKIMSEKSYLNPKSIYGHTKIIGEEMIKTYSRLYQIKYNIFRFFNICGKEQRNDFVITKFIQLIKNKKNINIYGSGSQIRSFCHVNDAVNGIMKIMLKGKNNEIYNIGNNIEPITIQNLAKKIIKFSKTKTKIVKTTFKESDRSESREVYFRIPDIKKIKKHTGFKPSIKLDSIIKECYLI
jgi:UDP-glucuronate decarboxylase